MQRDPVLEAVIGDVARGDGEGVLGKVDRVDPGIGEIPAREDGETAGAGAEVEHAFDLSGILDQRTAGFVILAAEMRVQQFADEGARHDGALVDIERQAAHVDLVDQIGGGFARGDAARDHVEDGLGLVCGDPRHRKRLELVGMQMQRFADQEGGLRHRIGGAMREHQFRFDEAAGGIAHEIEQRPEFAGCDLGQF